MLRNPAFSCLVHSTQHPHLSRGRYALIDLAKRSGIFYLRHISRRASSHVQKRGTASRPWSDQIDPKDLLSLKGKTTVITGVSNVSISVDNAQVILGGGRGIGSALASLCAQLGSHVAVIDTLERTNHDVARLDDSHVRTGYYRY